MAEFYVNDKTNLHKKLNGGRKLNKKQRKQEIISNLETTIQSEQAKVGGGNKELIERFQLKLENITSK